MEGLACTTTEMCSPMRGVQVPIPGRGREGDVRRTHRQRRHTKAHAWQTDSNRCPSNPHALHTHNKSPTIGLEPIAAQMGDYTGKRGILVAMLSALKGKWGVFDKADGGGAANTVRCVACARVCVHCGPPLLAQLTHPHHPSSRGMGEWGCKRACLAGRVAALPGLLS